MSLKRSLTLSQMENSFTPSQEQLLLLESFFYSFLQLWPVWPVPSVPQGWESLGLEMFLYWDTESQTLNFHPFLSYSTREHEKIEIPPIFLIPDAS